ncbi:extracellular solute-binding protein [Paenibacillus sp. J5C_2022]|uniref:extracellular solute-binding protein n=1 Tax=Paenibacillus sp. J5C2022 TaxID=2977129 RepID=UPI0021D1A7AB|nr:extracellular solute-binding protein [Paenibacillus sp. J5C2022]MCU6712226.1 extracellular solute-binding protein [Paenibacillus sp. J5C2022]
MRQSFALILSFVLTMMLLTACSGNGNNDNNNAGPSATTGSGQAGPDSKTLTALLDNNATFPYSEDWPIWKWLKEKTGVTLDVQTPSGKLGESLNLVVASKSMPDLMYMPNRNESNKFGQDGALVDILEYVDQMPNLKAWMEQYPEEAKAALSADGKMYMFPNQGFGETNRMIWLYREDVFAKEGLTAPKTYDELYDTLKALKTKYPDSYPLSIRYGQIPDEMNANMTVNFETGEGAYYDFDAMEWRYGPIEDNYKAMVAMWKKFYDDGLIPPDFLSLQTKQWQDMMSTGQSFMTIDYISRVDFFNNAMQKENPDYNMQFMAPPAGLPGGKQQNPYFHYLVGGLTVSSTSKNIKDVMQYMDFFYSEEGRLLASWGAEGETFVREGGAIKFKPEFTDVTEMRKQTGLQTSGTYTWIDYNAHLSLFSDNLQKAYTEAGKYDPPGMQPRPAFTESENEVISLTGQAIKKHRDESFAKFITGSRSLNEWDQYVEELDRLGVDKLLETYRTAYDRMQAVK